MFDAVDDEAVDHPVAVELVEVIVVPRRPENRRYRPVPS